MKEDELTKEITGAGIEVHRELGPGLLESIYEACLALELDLRGIAYQRQKSIPLTYKGRSLASDLRIDLLVENEVIVELKAAERLLPVHEAQLLTYLRLTNIRVGLLMNFNVPVLKDGIKRMVNGLVKTLCLRVSVMKTPQPRSNR